MNSSEQRKCQECHIQAKKCIPSTDLPTIPRKQKCESELAFERGPMFSNASSSHPHRAFSVNVKSRSLSPVALNMSDKQSMSPATSHTSPINHLILHDNCNVKEVRTFKHLMQSFSGAEDQDGDNDRCLALYWIWKHKLLLCCDENIMELLEWVNKFRVELASAIEKFRMILW